MTTTTQEFIKKLRAFSIPLTGVPNFVEAEYLMKESADALEALQAEIERLNGVDADARTSAIDFRNKRKALEAERDQAIARLAELEKQEPVIYQAKTKPGFLSTSAYAWEDCEKADFLVYEADGVHVRGLYAAAGASLVATPIVAWAKSTPRKLRITTMDMGREDGWRPLGYTAAGASPVEPSQARVVEPVAAANKDAVLQASIDFIRELTGMEPPPIEVAPPETFQPFKTFADKVCAIFATPQAAAQPPAPGEAAREYITGYGDGREWAGATNQAQPERAPSDDPLQGAADWFLQADGEFFCVATVQRTLCIGYNRAQRLCDIAKERAAHGIKQGGQQ